MTPVLLICGAMLGLIYVGGIAVQNADQITVRRPLGLTLQSVGFLAVVLAGVSGGMTTLFSAILAMAVLRYMWRVEASLVVGAFVGIMVQAFSTRHIGGTDITALGATAIGVGAMFVGMVMMPAKHIAPPIARTIEVLRKSVKTMRSTGWAFSSGTSEEKPARFSTLIAAMKNPLPMVKAARAAKPAKAAATKAAKTKPAKSAKSTSSGSDADSSILTRIAAMATSATADDATTDAELEDADEVVLEELDVTVAAEVVEDSFEADDSVDEETKHHDDEIIAALEEMLKGEL